MKKLTLEQVTSAAHTVAWLLMMMLMCQLIEFRINTDTLTTINQIHILLLSIPPMFFAMRAVTLLTEPEYVTVQTFIRKDDNVISEGLIWTRPAGKGY